MIRILQWVVLGIACPCALLNGSARAQVNIMIDVGRGPVTVHVPAGYDPGVPAPLVVLLHGYGVTGAQQEQYFKFTPLSDQYGFILTYPDGMIDLLGNRFWNATNACCNFFASGVDDSTYLLDLVTAIEAQLSVDPRRIYSAGHSNGGFMSYRLACDHPGKFAAIASLAGATFANPASCAPVSPVYVLQMHGTLDTTIFYGGGSLLGMSYPGAVATVQQWASFGGCSPVGVPGASNLDLDASIPGAETIVTHYSTGCQPAGSAELWTIVGGSHSPALSSQFGPRVVEFLLAHPKPDPGRVYCTAKTNSCGALPAISSSGLPSASSTSGFTVQAAGAKALKAGLLIYTDSGRALPATPFLGGWLCINAAPLKRSVAVVDTSGTPGACDGTLAIDVNAFAAGTLGGNPIPSLRIPGTQVNCQFWGRDTLSGALLSDALDYLVSP